MQNNPSSSPFISAVVVHGWCGAASDTLSAMDNVQFISLSRRLNSDLAEARSDMEADHQHPKPKQGMGKWKAKCASHFPTPSTAAT
jgi:hypothetical protein